MAQVSPLVADKTAREEGAVNGLDPSVTAGQPQTQSSDPPARSAEQENSLGFGLLERIAKDQKQIWTSPRYFTWADADLLVPFGMATGALLATDTEASKHLSNSPSRLKYDLHFSNYGLGAMMGLGGGIYAWGQLTHDDHKKETGILAGEAAVNGSLVTTVMKYALGRSRPLDSPPYQGDFWHGGTSMPSEHAAVSWAVASVIAHEYPGPMIGLLAYGLAGAISMSRADAKQHFPADVLIGSAIGWYMGKQAYRAHHNPELGGTDWQSYGEAMDDGPNGRTTSLGTTFVPLDSWIYPALKRLMALGYIKADYLGIQPWTRIECSRLIQEAGERISAETSPSDEVSDLYAVLSKEFTPDSERAAGGRPNERSGRIESLYTRVTGISGPPLHDSYHFGETLINDYGRPYGEGVNAIDGLSGWATQGRFAIYIREEYQYAPSSPTYSATVNNAISVMDDNPVQPGIFPSASQFRILDAYVSSNQSNWVFSFGKQSFWWGPNYGSDTILSNNAEPFYAFRVSRSAPFTLPWILHWIGPMKIDAFMGKLSGHGFPARPLFHGEKVSFKPTPDLEIGFSRTVVFSGVGRRPLTFGLLYDTYFSFSSTNANQVLSKDPGDRHGGFDFNWRLPYVRNWLSIYTNSEADDDPTAIAAPRRGAWNPGIYLTRFPHLNKWDLRVEAGYTDFPTSESHGGKFIYYNQNYHDSYTNKNYILGTWIGREGHGYQAWTTYHQSARNWIQFGYRHGSVSGDFVPGGVTLNDGSVSVNRWLRNDLNLSGLLQYEQWKCPLLAPGPQTNWTTSLQIEFHPRSWRR